MNYEIVNVPSIIPDLLNLCPGIESDWQDHLEFWENDEAGEYNEISVIVHYTVNSFKENKTDFFPKLFNYIEEVISSGHPKQKEMAIIGFLETLQTVGSNKPFGFEPFEQWLGPLSQNAWNEIQLTWEGKSTLADVIRAETSNKS